jgi:hypothetical protein
MILVGFIVFFIFGLFPEYFSKISHSNKKKNGANFPEKFADSVTWTGNKMTGAILCE